MNKLTLTLGVAVFAVLGTAAQTAEIYTPGEPVRGDFKNFARVFLKSHCFDCHDNDTAKGDLSLEDLGSVDETSAAVWKSIWAQVTLQEMPPKKKSQLGIIDRLRFSDWIVSEARLPEIAIGEIDVGDTTSIVEVHRDRVETVLGILSKRRWQGAEVNARLVE